MCVTTTALGSVETHQRHNQLNVDKLQWIFIAQGTRPLNHGTILKTILSHVADQVFTVGANAVQDMCVTEIRKS